MTGLSLILIFLALLLFNIPIMIAIGVASVVYCVIFEPVPMSMIMSTYFNSLDSFPLIAVPFFILAGELMMQGGISTRLINFCRALLGSMTGALGSVTVVASMIFAAVAGSGTATVACIGGITIPEMLRERYNKGFACALAATAGALGPIIPPSVAMILYGVCCGVSITKLFIGGVVPGILITVGLILLVTCVAKKNGYGLSPEEAAKARIPVGKAFREALWSLVIPGIILGGIYGGIFTPTEAAVVACVVAIFVGIFMYKEYTFRELPKVFKKATLTSGTILLLVACATALGRLLTVEQIPEQLAEGLLAITDNKYLLLLIINGFLLVVGMFMETYAAIIILAPVLLPAVEAVGVDPLHFGLIMTVNLTIGLCTPPVGVNLFIATRIGNCPIEDMFKWLLPLLGVLIGVLMLITYIPPLTMWLPSLL
ncbi:C4-dicarboxylate transport system (Permease large protein) [uncultured delta proteobacterium]|uniref:C4-dicarboxylate transport system (Permease large protein) n=1 Tax=uncultured delta proteobacterium TaxID=34034 RepID=A0A212J8X4_9DELT|nr:C4-dicarboxylate transport system (Permease large protein) [uncultured delta proteobacterium]